MRRLDFLGFGMTSYTQFGKAAPIFDVFGIAITHQNAMMGQHLIERLAN